MGIVLALSINILGEEMESRERRSKFSLNVNFSQKSVEKIYDPSTKRYVSLKE